MAKTYHLAVDLGATSGRTILAAFDGSKVEMEELTRFKYPMLPFNGHLFGIFPFYIGKSSTVSRRVRKYSARKTHKRPLHQSVSIAGAAT